MFIKITYQGSSLQLMAYKVYCVVKEVYPDSFYLQILVTQLRPTLKVKMVSDPFLKYIPRSLCTLAIYNRFCRLYWNTHEFLHESVQRRREQTSEENERQSWMYVL